VPLELRANDVTRHIINIDSRFRDDPADPSSNFYYRLIAPVKNVLRIRLTSIEFPNNYLQFTDRRKNVTIRILYDKANPKSLVVTVPEGNYTACEMQDALNAIITPVLPWLTVAFDGIAGTFVFTGSQYYMIDTTYMTFNRRFDYGLGYYLGFTRTGHKAYKDASNNWIVESNSCAYFAGDNYVFLRVNDYACVRQRTDTEEFTALAKIVLREPKNNMAFDDYASQHVKEVVFPAPTDLSRFLIQVLDAYGNVMDLCNAQISFSMEVLEVKNINLYNTIRDSISLTYV
jgi:hypothetical protein